VRAVLGDQAIKREREGLVAPIGSATRKRSFVEGGRRRVGSPRPYARPMLRANTQNA